STPLVADLDQAERVAAGHAVALRLQAAAFLDRAAARLVAQQLPARASSGRLCLAVGFRLAVARWRRWLDLRRVVALRDRLLRLDLLASVVAADFVACLAGDLDAGIALGAEAALADQRTDPRGLAL